MLAETAPAETFGVAALHYYGDIALLLIDSPPVNALSSKVCGGLYWGLNNAINNRAIKAIVISCAGRTFHAGADISEFNQTFDGPDLYDALGLIENSTKPIIAAIFGTALGGGLEVALTTHYRVAAKSAQFGLPEVKLGLLPGAGGTQRLPRLTGAEIALEMIGFGNPIKSSKAFEYGMIDEICPDGEHIEASLQFARKAIDDKMPLRLIQNNDEKILSARGNSQLFDDFRHKNARAFKGFKAPENIIKSIEAAVNLPFAEGMKRERELFEELLESDESAAQRYIFFAERAVFKVPDIDASIQKSEVKNIGIIGAGTMGSGIAMNFLSRGFPVIIIDKTQKALDDCCANIRKIYQNSVAKGRINPEHMEQSLSLLETSCDIKNIANCDLIIEAVFENMAIKQDIFKQLGVISKPTAILASNTSFLDLNEIARASGRPEMVVGMHFFSPANIMRLLEIVRGEKTAKEVIATMIQLAKVIGKTAVVSGVCHGFIANRAMWARTIIAEQLLTQGIMPWDIDMALKNYGFPIGVFEMLDIVGIDVIGWDAATSKGETIQEILCEQGRLGQKRGAGYYDYDENRKPNNSEFVEKIILEVAAKNNAPPISLNENEIIELLLYPIVNEGAKIMQEKIALRASDIDVALVQGFGWPIYRGGPMFWGDMVGLKKIVARLEEFTAKYGDIYRPCDLLQTLARENKTLHDL